MQLAYRRFISKYGPPEIIYSDSAPTFISFKRSLKNYSPIWNFRVPHVAWRGGHYERFVSTIKFHLRRTLSHGIVAKTFAVDETRTIISEIETIINNRPISFDSSNSQEVRPLRPIDFIRPLGQPNLPFSLTDLFPSKLKSTSQAINDMWKTNFMKISFWKKWSNDYILPLRERHKNLTQKSDETLN